MFTTILALHLLAVVFIIGPLTQAATTAVRGVRRADAAAVTEAARVGRIYTFASFVVVILGFGLLGMQDENHDRFRIGQPWIWVSLLLWLLAGGLSLGVLVPSLDRAATEIGAGRPVRSLRGRVAGSGGLIGLLFAAIVVLMVARPGA